MDTAGGDAVGNEDLYGTWRLLNYSERVLATGEASAYFGNSPQGFLSYSRDGRMFAIIAREGRRKPADMARLTAEERAELFDTMAAYAGTFTFDGRTVIHHVDISWNENWTGTDQVRHARFEGGRLHITSAPLPSDVDGRTIVGELTWEKIK